MNKDIAKKLDAYAAIAGLLTRQKARFGSTPTNLLRISRFKIETSTLLIVSQHRGMILNGITKEIPQLKLSLCNLTVEIATVLYNYSCTQKNGTSDVRRPPGVVQLFNRLDHSLIKYCTKIHVSAMKHRKMFARTRIEFHSIDTLKSATDLYNSIIPPPRTVMLVAEQFAKQIADMTRKTEQLLVREIDPMMKVLKKANPIIFNDYLLARKKSLGA
jgi:hypothetical protein